MKQSKKYIALALILALTAAAVGCGGKKQEAAPETEAAPGKDADSASETVGSGAGGGTEASGKKQAQDFMFVDQWITSIEEDRTEMTLVIAHHVKEAKTVEFSYEEVLLDGAAAQNWKAHGRGADTFTIDPDAFQSFPQTLILGVNIENYSELTIHATANFDDGTEPYPFSVTYQISELERKIKEKPAAASKEIYVEEQVIFQEDTYGNTISVLGMDDGPDSTVLMLYYMTDGAAARAFELDELYIGDTLVYSETQGVREIEIEFENQGGGPGEPVTQYIFITDEAARERIRQELPEISVVFQCFVDDTQTSKVSFPVLSK